jgi:hypothetical protein
MSGMTKKARDCSMSVPPRYRQAWLATSYMTPKHTTLFSHLRRHSPSVLPMSQLVAAATW